MNTPHIRTLDTRLSQLTSTIAAHGVDAHPYARIDHATCERVGLDYAVVVDYQATLYALCAAINSDVNPDMEAGV